MDTKEVSARQLKELDPKRFTKEYYDWMSGQLDYDWSEFLTDDFKQHMKEYAVNVEHVYFDDVGSGYPVQVSIVGWVDLWQFMDKVPQDGELLSALYPALYLAVKQDESWVKIDANTRRRTHSLTVNSSTSYTIPHGLFAGLDEDTWQELVDTQWAQLDPERTVQEFLNDECYELGKSLQKEYDYLVSEESFIESCECNEVTFTLEMEHES